MADHDLEAVDIERKVHDLAQSMERVKSRQADRDDVVVDMKHARLSRLEILAENLKPVFDAVPDTNEQFEFALMKGETPRLWVDMTSFVRMAGDGRDFEFVKDTRMGRTILGRSSKVEDIGEHVSDYVAERVLERERMIEGEWVSMKPSQAKPIADVEDSTETTAKTKNKKRYAFMKTALWFAIGLIVGGGFLTAAVWFDKFDTIISWVTRLTI